MRGQRGRHLQADEAEQQQVVAELREDDGPQEGLAGEVVLQPHGAHHVSVALHIRRHVLPHVPAPCATPSRRQWGRVVGGKAKGRAIATHRATMETLRYQRNLMSHWRCICIEGDRRVGR
jgi:hypothetical protein